MSFVTEIEEVIDELSDWAVETVLEIINAIMPDGKPFFRELKTPEEELQEYAAIRGNQEAWVKWMAERTGDLILELQDSAVSPEAIISVHPVDIIQKSALAWSASMEEMIKKEPYNAIFS